MSGTLLVNTKFGEYPVIVGEGLDFGGLAREAARPCRAMIVSDDIVFPLYGGGVSESFGTNGFSVGEYVIRNGEGSKTLATVEGLLGFLAKENLTRGDILVALGGGVVGDITGFAAAIYLRGIDFIQIPTTILAAVDSSVGGKTGVDLSAGKNLVGAFHQPRAVYCDPLFFATLPKEVYADGMAEVIKHGMIADRGMLEGLGKMPEAGMCMRNIEIKARFVEQDEFDTGVRKILNFGHTVGHAVEKLSGYGVSHGKAVAIGMTVISRASERYGLTEEPVLEDLTEALEKYGLPTRCGFSAGELAGAALHDKKRMGGTISLVIPKSVGHAELYELPVEKLEAFIAAGLEE